MRKNATKTEGERKDNGEGDEWRGKDWINKRRERSVKRRKITKIE